MSGAQNHACYRRVNIGRELPPCSALKENGSHAQRSEIMTDSQRTDFPAFTEHRVQRDRGSLYVRDFPGSGAAFVLLHGFPDNSHTFMTTSFHT